MNPLTYFEIFSFLFRIHSFLWYFGISESSHLFRNILFPVPNTFFSMIFRHKWILSLISKYSLSSSDYILFYDISDISESSHLFRKHSLFLFRIRSFLWYFRHKWILSLMSKCPSLLFSYSIYSMLFRVSESSHLFRDICFLLSVYILFYITSI